MDNQIFKKCFQNCDCRKIFQSKIFRGVSGGILALIVLLLVFKFGMMAGERQAGFSYRWGDNYNRNFAGPKTVSTALLATGFF